jgi:hypothetical protein
VPNHKLSENICQDPFVSSVDNDFANRRCSNNNNNNNNNMWKQNTVKAIPIAISSTGVIPKSLSQSLKRLHLHPNTYIQMQKSVILGTCSVARNFLNYN